MLNVRHPCLSVCLSVCLSACLSVCLSVCLGLPSWLSLFCVTVCCSSVDCWDGSNGEPDVYHGYTLTSHILFKDIIVAIREHAFETSEQV